MFLYAQDQTLKISKNSTRKKQLDLTLVSKYHPRINRKETQGPFHLNPLSQRKKCSESQGCQIQNPSSLTHLKNGLHVKYNLVPERVFMPCPHDSKIVPTSSSGRGKAWETQYAYRRSNHFLTGVLASLEGKLDRADTEDILQSHLLSLLGLPEQDDKRRVTRSGSC